MTPPMFHGAAAVVPFLVLSVALHGAAVFLTTSLNVAKRTRALPVAAAVAAAVTVAGHVHADPAVRTARRGRCPPQRAKRRALS